MIFKILMNKLRIKKKVDLRGGCSMYGKEDGGVLRIYFNEKKVGLVCVFWWFVCLILVYWFLYDELLNYF